MTPEQAAEEYPVCEFCKGKGGISRQGLGGCGRWVAPLEPKVSWRVHACDCCGQIGEQAEADRLNAIDLERSKGYRYERTVTSPCEDVIQKLWLKEITPVPGLNGGAGLMLGLLSTAFYNNDPLSGRRNKPVPPEEFPTERDYKVAATVIQWLGSNCGRAFLDTVRKEWDRLSEEQIAEYRRKIKDGTK